MNLILKSALLLALVSCSTQKSSDKKKTVLLPATVEGAVGSPLRSEDFKKRDLYRHPAETLNFFGITPEMTVVEIWPSGGWYTEILAPYLSSQGKYIIADPAADPNGYTNKRKDWMIRNPEIASKVIYSTFQPPQSVAIAPAGSVDMVLTFRNIHNWQPAAAQMAAFKSFYQALKPGGVLGVVEHRAHPKKRFDPKSGYMLEKEVIRMASKAGFKLASKSEINSNAKDRTVHPEGVWTLPPRLKLGDKDKAKYLEIGESDRMTLKFVKPL